MASDTVLPAPSEPVKPPEAVRPAATTQTRASVEVAILPAPEEVVAKLRKDGQERSPMLPRMRLFSDMPDRGLFVLFITVGFVLILSAKTGLWYLGFLGDYSIVIACAAAAVMLTYGVLAYRMSAVRLRPDRLGDNFYYMGFVFTLASMSAALVQIQSGREVDSLIGSFGIALFSTILGIAGRVAFIQMRTEVEDIEERSRQNLIDAASTLRGQLSSAVKDLESFRTGVQQAIQERLTESADAFSKMTEGQVRHIKDTVEGTIESVKTAFEAHEKAAGSIAQLADKVTGSVDHLVQRIEAINVPPSLLEAKMDALLVKLGQTASAFENVAEADKDRHKDLAAASVELRRVVTQVANQLTKLKATAEMLQEATNPATSMAESLGRARQALDATAGAATALGEATTVAREASRELSGSIKAYGEMVVGVTSAQQSATAAIAAEVDAARKRMMDDVEQSRAAVAEVQKALADTARIVAQAINAPAPQ